MTTDDPLEAALARALRAAGVEFVHESDDKQRTRALDFYLPAFDVYVECKQFHTPRTEEQMSRVQNIIVLQGSCAVAAFASMLRLAALTPETP